MNSTDKLSLAIIVAAAIIAWSISSRPASPVVGRYAFTMSGDWIQRFDTVSGEALICNKNRCIAADDEGERDAYPSNESLDDALKRLTADRPTPASK